MRLFDLKRTAFVLWRPRHTLVPPVLVIGQFEPGNPPGLRGAQRIALRQPPGIPDLWTVDAASCGLTDGETYHYWFEVTDSSPAGAGARVCCTDPIAFTVDWRVTRDGAPAAVVAFEDGALRLCDPDGTPGRPAVAIAADAAAPNNRLVIYELPTSWARINIHGDPQVGVGTFRDVLALVDPDAEGMNFAASTALRAGRSHLGELGVNALELLPAADSFVEREWGYATSHYFAPDHDLGFPAGHSSPTPHADLAALITTCHEHGIRFIADMVMAFGTHTPTEQVNFDEFHIDARANPTDPDAHQSSGQGIRDGFGGQLWRYARAVDGYDPLSGATGRLVPARSFMLLYLLHWMSEFAIDGVRMDSVNNVANWDFVQEFKTSRAAPGAREAAPTIRSSWSARSCRFRWISFARTGSTGCGTKTSNE